MSNEIPTKDPYADFEKYPIYDRYVKDKDRPIKVSSFILQAAFIERAIPLMRHSNLKGMFADNRKRPKRLRKKLWKRLGFRKVKPLIDPGLGFFLNIVLDDLKNDRSPYIKDKMVDMFTKMANGGPDPLNAMVGSQDEE